MMYSTPKFLGSGESCLTVEFSDRIEVEANVRLQNLMCVLAEKNIKGIIEFVPTYRSLSIHHNPLKLPRKALEKIVTRSLADLDGGVPVKRLVVTIPVLYGGEYGPDMDYVSRHTGFDAAEVIRRHSTRDYYCYMLGFTPGFAYLGGLDDALETPRLENPRVLIPSGSVGIAGKQTGVYSINSPGGWRLIGRTPVRLFDPNDEKNPTFIQAGNWVRFQSICKDEYVKLSDAAAAGEYAPECFFEESGALCR
jgi:KipI family sensor histidine kinase inhibitor